MAAELHDARAELRRIEERDTEPVAIVAMACRFPGGVASPEDLWRLVAEGRDAIGPLPTDRGWDVDGLDAVTESRVRQGGFLDRVADFDPEFFGISPREALAMDPQQRVLLEVGWELFERAGLDRAAVRGSRTGVFVGGGWTGYGSDLGEVPDGVGDHLATGTIISVLSGRLAFLYGLEGPAVTVDTACSSSLVALHLAVRALRGGECTMALAGGVTVMPHMGVFGASGRQHGMAPDGRCKAFGAGADGTGWSEGAGLLLLQRLSDARRAGRRVLAVVRGSAVNQDGAGSGLTTPNGSAQRRVIRQALADARLTPDDIDAVEASATGTPLGDPIEARALLAGYGSGRDPRQPLWLGSLKSNVGHTQSAAGVAGVIKTVMALRHGVLPKTLHVDEPTPHVDWSAGTVRLLTEARPWPDTGERPRRAGVSSFGISGTNAHVVVEQAPEESEFEPERIAVVNRPPAPWVLSARDEEGLRAQAERLATRVTAEPDLVPDDVAYSLATTRTALACRAAVTAADLDGFAARLRALAAGEGTAVMAARDPRPVFVFPDHGPSYRTDPFRELLDMSPEFAATIAECQSALDPWVDWSIAELLRATDERAPTRVDVAEPLSWAVAVAFARLWQAHGVQPAAVVGHGHGEIAAACVAGGLTLADGAKVAALRGRALHELAGTGGMVAGAVSDHAPNTPHVEAIRARLTRDLADIAPMPATVPFHSSATGTPADTAVLDADHWYGNPWRQVRFDDAVGGLSSEGHNVFVEIGAQPVLTIASADTIAADVPAVVPAIFPRRADGSGGFAGALAAAHVHGLDVDWRHLFDGSAVPPRRVDLPTYAFRRRRFWPVTVDDGEAGGGHPLLGARPARLAAGPAGADGGAPVRGNSSTGNGDPDADRLVRELLALDAPARERALTRLVRAQAAAALGYDTAEAVDPDSPFRSLGVDSVIALDLRNRLAAHIGRQLPATLVFDHPTVVALARHLGTELLTPGAQFPSHPALVPTRADHEPLAIVGMACRFPGGVGSPEDLWRMLADGRDGLTDFPTDRGWPLDGLYHPDPDHPGTSYVRSGGFVEHATDFDAGFFGISPREALAMDPQQRLLLETSWEVFERAGIDPVTLRGSDTGVFVGAVDIGYPTGMHVPDELGGYLGTGNAASVASGRLAYTFGLEGPAITVDTACSSSLVALHLAGQALRGGECSMALAGGVTVYANPAAFVEFSRQRVLAADGRCKPFASAADGTGWSEGIGMLLVERLSDARRNGHRVLATILGSAVNQDGASNGLTAPNGPAQQRVIRQALANAGLTARDVDAVEAHGTGTALGDPIEARALIATYGREHHADEPVWLGALKSNIGHTTAAAGVAGVIKMVLAMRHGVVPKTLHVDAPTPHVDWSAGTVELSTEARPWPETGRPRRAAVSSFGISGTNAHTVLEYRPPEPADPPELPGTDAGVDPGVLPYLLSAKTPQALAAQAERLHAHLTAEGAGIAPADLAAALAGSRAALEHRAVVTAADRAELLAGLAALAAGDPIGTVTVGLARAGRRPVFLFGGQGGQRVGMGRELHAVHPAFAAAFDEVVSALDDRLAGHVAYSVRDVVFGMKGTEGLLDETVFAQAGLFAVECALFRLVESFGVRPEFLLGHSIGELAAAHVAGVWSLADAATVVAARGRLMQALPAGGAMVAVQATEDEVRSTLDRRGAACVAAVNGPVSVVVSGDEDAVLAVAARFAEQGRRTRRLRVGHAFHSARMEPMQAEFRAVLAGVSYADPRIPMLSNLTGSVAGAGELASPDYWLRQVREPVRFADCVAWVRASGDLALVDVGPDGASTAMARECLGPAAQTPTAQTPTAETPAVALLRRDRPERATFTAALGALHVHGTPVDWSALLTGRGAAVDLPTYPFQRQRYWLDPLPDTRTAGDPDRWRYRAEWTPWTERSDTEPTGTWLVVSHPASPYTDACVQALEGCGAAVTRLRVDATECDRGVLAEHLRRLGPLDGVLSLLSDLPGEPADLPGLTHGLAATLALARAFADTRPGGRLWCVTSGAVSVAERDPLGSADQAGIWGFGRTAALELPGLWGGLVDLPDGTRPTVDTVTEESDAVDVRSRLAGVLAQGAEDQVAIRADGVHVRRLVRAPATARTADRPWQPTGTVLITGGTGGLGAHVARWAAGAGAERVVLAARRGARAPGAQDLAAELSGLGVAVLIESCDTADRHAVERLVERIDVDGPPLSAVVHAAGVAQAALIADTDPVEAARVIAGKAAGAAHLDAVLGERPLAAFVLFSSIAGVWGSGGQGVYAAANAHLDALARDRRARGLTATSIAWGPWAGGGMVEQADGNRLARLGLRAMDPQAAVTAMTRAVGRGDADVVVADVDWPAFAASFTSSRPSPLLRGLPEVDAALAAPAAGAGAADPDLIGRLAAAGPTEREAILLDLVRGQVAAVLGHTSAARIRADQAFGDLGFDSLTAVDLRDRLGRVTGVELPSTLVFDHPTPVDLAARLRAALTAGDPSVLTPVLAELDGLEAAFDRVADEDPQVRARVVLRMRRFVERLGALDRDDTATPDGAGVEAASDDELFALLDHHLEAPGQTPKGDHS
ncbi:SDR family NAD(P)-dependent oxidoreductase [Embleya sp. NPDC059237]|uniref:SDR family NAD(P)-dependent oxidoreductase n=1 Tax=Embleya sp. NPDC059237 TaxID=3346784 RepID=UPI00369271DE